MWGNRIFCKMAREKTMQGRQCTVVPKQIRSQTRYLEDILALYGTLSLLNVVCCPTFFYTEKSTFDLGWQNSYL